MKDRDEIAQALASLGGIGVDNPLASVRKGLGLDRLSFGGDSTGTGGTVQAGKYVANGVYVGAKQGAAGNSSRGVVEIDVLDHTKVEGDIGADSNGRVGVKMEWDY